MASWPSGSSLRCCSALGRCQMIKAHRLGTRTLPSSVKQRDRKLQGERCNLACFDCLCIRICPSSINFETHFCLCSWRWNAFLVIFGIRRGIGSFVLRIMAGHMPVNPPYHSPIFWIASVSVVTVLLSWSASARRSLWPPPSPSSSFRCTSRT